MSGEWQQLIVAGLVALSVAVVARRVVRAWRGGTAAGAGCAHGCSSCPAGRSARDESLVTLSVVLPPGPASRGSVER